MSASTQKALGKKNIHRPRPANSGTAAHRDAMLTVKSDGGHKLVLREQLGMTRDTFARMLPVSTRSLADIEAGKQPPSEATTRRLTELQRLTDALGEVIRPEAIGDWLKLPNTAFDGLKPLEVIDRGETDRLWRMIYLLRSGTPG
ncbi:MAG: helix-turn-helix domain-containing protein [Planctomycetaceae bacterium]